MNYPSLYDISDKITEAEYRADGKMHYSTLAKFDRSGFQGLKTLFDRVESPSLLLGSIVDTLITDGIDAFNAQYVVAAFPEISDQIANVVRGLYNTYKDIYNSINDIPNNIILAVLDSINYGKSWKVETRLDKVRKPGEALYNLLFLSEGKTLVSNEVYNTAYNMVNALKTSPATSFLFAENSPFEPNVERFYQLKFSDTIDGIDYSGMLDEVVVFHDKKVILPIDLKTSGHAEYEFYKSFIDWSYSIQARQYSRLLRNRMDKDPYFKDFKLLNYHFVVANKYTLTPLLWEYKDTHKFGTLYYGKNNQYVLRDPFDIAKELKYYLDNQPIVPIGIDIDKPNDIIKWLNEQ